MPSRWWSGWSSRVLRPIRRTPKPTIPAISSHIALIVWRIHRAMRMTGSLVGGGAGRRLVLFLLFAERPAEPLPPLPLLLPEAAERDDRPDPPLRDPPLLDPPLRDPPLWDPPLRDPPLLVPAPPLRDAVMPDLRWLDPPVLRCPPVPLEPLAPPDPLEPPAPVELLRLGRLPEVTVVGRMTSAAVSL